MDVVKLQAKSEQDIDLFIHLAWIYSKHIGIPFELEKRW